MPRYECSGVAANESSFRRRPPAYTIVRRMMPAGQRVVAMAGRSFALNGSSQPPPDGCWAAKSSPEIDARSLELGAGGFVLVITAMVTFRQDLDRCDAVVLAEARSFAFTGETASSALAIPSMSNGTTDFCILIWSWIVWREAQHLALLITTPRTGALFPSPVRIASRIASMLVGGR